MEVSREVRLVLGADFVEAGVFAEDGERERNAMSGDGNKRRLVFADIGFNEDVGVLGRAGICAGATKQEKAKCNSPNQRLKTSKRR